MTGGATVILALGAGRRAARHIVQYLRSETWPPKPMDAPEAAHAPGQGRCPRCHGSLEEGEQYICCAGRELEWHCTSCQKIYEGYAFPFGLCSACGGKLARNTNGTSQDTETQRTIQEALEIELGGMSFYRRGAELTDDPELETLFRNLADMEQEHIAILARRYHVQPPDPEHVTLKRAPSPSGSLDRKPAQARRNWASLPKVVASCERLDSWADPPPVSYEVPPLPWTA